MIGGPGRPEWPPQVARPLVAAPNPAWAKARLGRDLGGIGKEWAADRLRDQARAAGIVDCLIELGGDCAASGHQPGHSGWWVALPGAQLAVLLRDEAIATSGHGVRYRELDGCRVSHLIDARSGTPATGAVGSASVIAHDCLDAGIRASDLCLLGAAEPAAIAQRSSGFPSWCIRRDGLVLADQPMADRVFTISGREAA